MKFSSISAFHFFSLLFVCWLIDRPCQMHKMRSALTNSHMTSYNTNQYLSFHSISSQLSSSIISSPSIHHWKHKQLKRFKRAERKEGGYFWQFVSPLIAAFQYWGIIYIYSMWEYNYIILFLLQKDTERLDSPCLSFQVGPNQPKP